ncbi:MAG: hypothetical protein GEU98_18450 [Pseudonocardiaceae bacterium]|nr:hypothetical protein [Pseudonocardiaceae bacterium]
MTTQSTQRPQGACAAHTGQGNLGGVQKDTFSFLDDGPDLGGLSQVDLERPNVARMYDYGLGGAHNFAVDRRQVDLMHRINPEGPLCPRANRDFLRRAVQFCAGQGIDQFLDLGSGLPTVGNVHEVAQEINPDARVVYVDNEAIAVEHTRRILADNDLATIVHADLRQPDTILAEEETLRLLDFSRPVALLIVAALHYVDTNPGIVLNRYRDALAPGSYFVGSHLTGDDRPDIMRAIQEKVFSESSTPLTVRTREEVTALFDGFELVEPGVVYTSDWRPGPEDYQPRIAGEVTMTWAGVGRKP